MSSLFECPKVVDKECSSVLNVLHAVYSSTRFKLFHGYTTINCWFENYLLTFFTFFRLIQSIK